MGRVDETLHDLPISFCRGKPSVGVALKRAEVIASSVNRDAIGLVDSAFELVSIASFDSGRVPATVMTTP